MTFSFDEGLGIDLEHLPKLAQETRGGVQANRRLQIGAL